MNAEERIEKCLKAAPKPPIPGGLLSRLQRDVRLGEADARPTVLRRWFAPSGGSVSPRRVAVAAAMAMVVLLPLGYGAAKLIKRFAATSQLPAIKVDFPGSVKLSPDGKHFAES